MEEMFMSSSDAYLEELSPQLPALQLLINLGWHYLPTAEALALRDGKQKHVVLTGVLDPRQEVLELKAGPRP